MLDQPGAKDLEGTVRLLADGRLVLCGRVISRSIARRTLKCADCRGEIGLMSASGHRHSDFGELYS